MGSVVVLLAFADKAVLMLVVEMMVAAMVWRGWLWWCYFTIFMFPIDKLRWISVLYWILLIVLTLQLTISLIYKFQLRR